MSLFGKAHQASQEMPYASQALSGMWYVAAINSGSTAINLLQKGAVANNLKEFVGMTVVSVITARQGILHLEEYLDSRGSQAEQQAIPAQQADLS